MRTKNYTSSPWSQSCIAVVSVHLVRVRCGPVTASSKKEEATARAAVQANMPLHRMRHACSARFLIRGNSWRARAMAKALTNFLVSSDQRPPTSRATTTSCARPRGPRSSG